MAFAPRLLTLRVAAPLFVAPARKVNRSPLVYVAMAELAVSVIEFAVPLLSRMPPMSLIYSATRPIIWRAELLTPEGGIPSDQLMSSSAVALLAGSVLQS